MLSGGNEEELCGTFALISVIVRRYHSLAYGDEGGGDSQVIKQKICEIFRKKNKSYNATEEKEGGVGIMQKNKGSGVELSIVL